MKLIDAEKLQKQFDLKSTNPNYRVNMHNIKSIITNAPTVEAIPKADYEARLKADMVAMLTDIQLEIEEIVKEEELIDKKWAKGLHYSEKIIQQKINALKSCSDCVSNNGNTCNICHDKDMFKEKEWNKLNVN